jgi:hypothetical protein
VLDRLRARDQRVDARELVGGEVADVRAGGGAAIAGAGERRELLERQSLGYLADRRLRLVVPRR